MANFTILEPMSTGDVIDRSVRLYRRNFTPLISIVAVPSIIGYLTGLALASGYARLLTATVSPTSAGVQGGSVLLVILGLMGYPVWFFAQVFTLTGLARVVGDHLMMGEPITFRRCFSAARERLGDVLLLTLLGFAVLFVLGAVISIVFFGTIMVVALVVGITASSGLPQWLSGTLMVIFSLVAVAGGIGIALVVLARVVFLPQVMMIEGLSAGSSLGRAMTLGGRNWYRVGAILLFAYFVSLSLLAALTLPVALGLEWFHVSSVDFVLTPAGSAIYSAFNHLANLLSLPIWVVSFTLLYFDNRVRKEGYDMELIAKEVAPGFHWQAPAAQAYYPYGAYAPGTTQRVFMQTGPLGLGGYVPPLPPQPAPPVAQQDSTAEPKELAEQPAVVEAAIRTAVCHSCGLEVPATARFCIRCGSQVRT